MSLHLMIAIEAAFCLVMSVMCVLYPSRAVKAHTSMQNIDNFSRWKFLRVFFVNVALFDHQRSVPVEFVFSMLAFSG